ncbi:MAG: hypothetical protein CMB82_07765, partial [Flammeovirgaceae bacterium]|nr:hypothetical protein [Flammeovirgaceae bacterium]
KQEKKQQEEGLNTPYPSYEALKTERSEKAPKIVFTVINAQGKVVRKIMTTPKKGVNRLYWDMRYADTDPINLRISSFYNPWSDSDKGILVAPGAYQVSMSKIIQGEVISMGEPIDFNIKALDNRSLPGTDRMVLDGFNRKLLRLSGAISAASQTLQEVKNQLKYIDAALLKAEISSDHTSIKLAQQITKKVMELNVVLGGDGVARTLDIDLPPSLTSRMGRLVYMMFSSTSEPTKTSRDGYAIVLASFEPLLAEIEVLVNNDLKILHEQLALVRAPYTPYSLPKVPIFTN